jgi:hypothetical protein
MLWKLGVVASSKSGGRITLPAAGYILTGTTGDKYLFSNDTRSTINQSNNFSSNNGGMESSLAGYVGGTSGNASTVFKLSFINETDTTLATGLSAGRRAAGGMNSSTAGYFMGGAQASPVDYTSTVDKYLFSDDSRSVLANGLNPAGASLKGFNSSTAGYTGGGDTPGGVTSGVQKYTFSDDSRSTLATGLSQTAYMTCTFESSTAGFVAGGAAGGSGGGAKRTVVNKFAFSDDSRTTLASALPVGTSQLGDGLCSTTAGYVAGGRIDDAPNNSRAVYKYLFSDDSRSTLSDSLSADRTYYGGMNNK